MTRFSLHSSLLLTLTFALGCGEAKPATRDPTHPGSSLEHAGQGRSRPRSCHAAHGAGPHEGAVADWGGGKFHVEFTVDHDKQEATVYILGDDEKTATPIKAATILLKYQRPEVPSRTRRRAIGR